MNPFGHGPRQNDPESLQGGNAERADRVLKHDANGVRLSAQPLRDNPRSWSAC